MNRFRSTRAFYTIMLCVLWGIIFVSLLTLYQTPTTQAQVATLAPPTLTAWPITNDQLRRCSSLPIAAKPSQQPFTFTTDVEGKTRVNDAQTGQLLATISVVGEVVLNHCNNRILISTGEQGIFIFDGTTYQQIAHIPYLLTMTPKWNNVDLNVYAVKALDNTLSDDYLIKLRGPHYAHGGYWSAEDTVFIDQETLAVKPAISADRGWSNAFDPENMIYDPATNLFYTTATCCGDIAQSSVSAWNPDWQPKRLFRGLGGTGKPLMLLDHRLYTQQGRWLVALDVDTFRIAGTYPCCALPDTDTATTVSDLATGSQPDGWFYTLIASPSYQTDHILFLITAKGLYRSSDGATHWAHLLESSDMLHLWFSPTYSTDKMIFASLLTARPDTSEGLIRSTDGGDTWQPINVGLPSLRIYDLLFRADRVLVMASDATSQSYNSLWMISSNNGDLWQPADDDPNIQIPTSTPVATAIPNMLNVCGGGTAEGVIDPTAKFAVSGTGYGPVQQRLYKLTDACWTEVPLPINGYAEYVSIAIVAGADGNTILYVLVNRDYQSSGSGTLYTSVDGGETWKDVLRGGS